METRLGTGPDRGPDAIRDGRREGPRPVRAGQRERERDAGAGDSGLVITIPDLGPEGRVSKKRYAVRHGMSAMPSS